MLNEQAILISLTIAVPTARRKDRRAESTVRLAHDTHRNAVGVLKSLYPDEAIKPITKAAGEARKIVYQHTLPWEDRGMRLLPVTLYKQLHEQLAEVEAEFNTLKRKFILNYEDTVTDAQRRLGDLFDPTDYKPVDEVANSFNFEVTYSTVPAAGDVRIDAADHVRDEIEACIQDQTSQRFEAAVRNCYEQMHERVRMIATRMNEADTVVREELISNTAQIMDLLGGLNLSADPEIERLRLRIKQDLCGHTAAEIRGSVALRTSVGEAAERIAAEFEDYYG